MTGESLKEFLDYKASQYEHPRFIETDPISVPHSFTRKEDIEISGFLTATIAWGNRKSILSSAVKMMELMDNAPYDFIINHSESDLLALEKFVHRTFSGEDLKFFVSALGGLYRNKGGLESFFKNQRKTDNLQVAISVLKQELFDRPHPLRTRKHLADPEKGSAAKRINMFLRWMVRPNTNGVDFGLWNTISPAILSCPLDVHSGKVARKLGLLHRKQNDSKAVLELDSSLRKMDPNDPVKYDFALFGLGVFEKF